MKFLDNLDILLKNNKMSKNKLLKTIIDKVEYTKLNKKPRNAEFDNQFSLKIFLKI